MRKVVSFMHVSLDGFAAGPNGELEWAIVDGEMEPYIDALMETVDMAIYGRVTYHMMEGYWSTVPGDPSSRQHDIDHANWVEHVSKLVFSTTLEKVEWNNTRLVKDHIPEEIAQLKQESGGDMMIFGSPSIVHILTQHGLIDEYQIYVNPLIMGSGTPLFKGIQDSISLKLIEEKTFRSGVVGLRYQTVRK